jgi:hypothetical protein
MHSFQPVYAKAIQKKLNVSASCNIALKRPHAVLGYIYFGTPLHLFLDVYPHRGSFVCDVMTAALDFVTSEMGLGCL